MNPPILPMGQGLVAGAQAVAGGQGDPTNYNVRLQDNKAARVNELLQALGITTASQRHSSVGQSLGNF